MSMTISIDDDLKREFSEVCAEIGLSASAAFNVFAKRVVRDGKIPFTLDAQSEYDRSAREYERMVNEGVRRGYRNYEMGHVQSWDAVKANLNRASVEAHA